jgi:ABC-2 type transport system permease protein
MTTLWVLWRGFVLQFAESRASPMLLVHGVVQPLVLTAIVLGARTAPDAATVGRAIAGATTVAVWSVVLWSAGTVLLREQLGGTLGTILVRPVSLGTVLLGRTLCIAASATGSSMLAVGALLALRHQPVRLPGPATLVLLAVLAAASAACLGALLSTLILVVRGATRVVEAMAYLVSVLGGLLVPTSLLPAALRWPAQLVSLHYVAEMAGARRADPVRVALVLVLSAAYLGVGLLVMAAALRRARGRGTLELV